MSKRSTTLWITISIIALNPIAWFLQYFFNRQNMEYLVENGVSIDAIAQFIPNVNFDLPIQALATAAITAVGLYIGGNKTKAVTTNLSLAKGEGTGEDGSDDLPSSGK